MFGIDRREICHRVRDKLTEYIDGRLDIEGQGLLESHLEACDACSKEHETLRMTVRLLNQVPTVPAPRSFALREAEAGRERVPEPRTWGGLRPVPVFAISGVDGARAGIFDPQRMRWLRPATAVMAAALVLLLVLDFLQVVPDGGWLKDSGAMNGPDSQYLLEPSPLEEEDGLKLGIEDGVEPTLAVPPIPRPEATPEGASSGLFSSTDDGVELADDTTGGWPMRQLEIAIGALFFILFSLMMFKLRQGRKWSRV